MKKILVAILALALFAGCGAPKEGTIILPYEKPADFSHFEVFVGLAPGFTVTGWNGTAWTGSPNDPATWNGTTNTLKIISATEPIMITGLTPGVTYYVRVVAVDTSYNRSAPSVEYSGVAGGPPLAATLIVAASDASPATKAGADYVCDGTDDHVEIQTAIDAVAAIVGGSVILTEGTFTLGYRISLSADITLQGQGPSTILKLKNEYAILYMFHVYARSTIKDMTLDGNKANIAESVNGISKVSSQAEDDIKLTKLIIKNFTNSGISIVNGSRISVTDCTITGNESVGIHIGAYSNANIINNQVYNNDEHGIYIESNNAIINSNQINSNGMHGICAVGYIGCVNIQISNNQLIGNGIAANNTYSNIFLLAEVDEALIQNNTCRQGDGANKSKYGIRVDEHTCERNLITNNDCYQSGVTAGISDAGTNTNFGAGNRNNDGTWSTTPN